MTYRDSFIRQLAAKLYPNFHVHFDPSLRAHRQPPGGKKKGREGRADAQRGFTAQDTQT